MEIVINYDSGTRIFKIYEPSTDTLLGSANLTEALVNLSEFLKTSGHLGDSGILGASDINYHIDSATMIKMIESNVELLKRISTGPSAFTISGSRFGMSGTSSNPLASVQKPGKFGTSRGNKRSASFSGKSGFKSGNKKFGNQ